MNVTSSISKYQDMVMIKKKDSLYIHTPGALHYTHLTYQSKMPKPAMKLKTQTKTPTKKERERVADSKTELLSIMI